MTLNVRCYVLSESVDSERLKAGVGRKARSALVQTVSRTTASNQLLVEMIVAQTVTAEASGSLLAKKSEIDLLLRLAGTTQISAAIGAVGARKGAPCILIVAAEKRELDELERSALRGKERLPSRELSKSELDRVEAAALLNALRA